MTFATRLTSLPQQLDNGAFGTSLTAPPGVFFQRAQIARTPTIVVVAIGLTVEATDNLARILFISQKISSAYRLVIFGDDTVIEQYRGFGWALEHVPSELFSWDRKNGSWEQYVTDRLKKVTQWYRSHHIFVANPADEYKSLINGIDELTGFKMRNFIDRKHYNKSLETTGVAMLIGEAPDKTMVRHLVLPEGSKLYLTFTLRSGGGLVVNPTTASKETQDSYHEIAKMARWSEISFALDDHSSTILEASLDALSCELGRNALLAGDANAISNVRTTGSLEKHVPIYLPSDPHSMQTLIPIARQLIIAGLRAALAS